MIPIEGTSAKVGLAGRHAGERRAQQSSSPSVLQDPQDLHGLQDHHDRQIAPYGGAAAARPHAPPMPEPATVEQAVKLALGLAAEILTYDFVETWRLPWMLARRLRRLGGNFNPAGFFPVALAFEVALARSGKYDPTQLEELAAGFAAAWAKIEYADDEDLLSIAMVRADEHPHYPPASPSLGYGRLYSLAWHLQAIVGPGEPIALPRERIGREFLHTPRRNVGFLVAAMEAAGILLKVGPPARQGHAQDYLFAEVSK